MSHTTYLDNDRKLAAIHNSDFSGPIELVDAKFGPSQPTTISTTYEELETLILEKNRMRVIRHIEHLSDLVDLMEFVKLVNFQGSRPRYYQKGDN